MLSSADQAQTLLLTGSHAARRDINEGVRAALGLSGSAERIRVFRALDKTAAEKKQLETYQPGLTIRFEKDYRTLGVRRGETAQVKYVFSSAVILSLPDGTRRRMSPHRLNGRGWTVGVVQELEIAEGDRIRFTGTNPGAGYRNGERGVVEEVSADTLAIRRTDGSEVHLARGLAISLDYGYAATGHGAQGLDASRVILEKDTQSRTTNRRSFYTDLTRARDSAVVFTDSVLGLARRARVDRTKIVALDVAGQTGATSGGLELTKE